MAGLSLADWDEVGDVVEQALSLPDPARDTLLREACGHDVERLRRARHVLAAADRARGFLDRPAIEFAPDLLDAAASGTTEREPRPPAAIGAYRVRHLLGRGGMGEVYLAERADDEFRRQVAVKVVRPALGADLIARFRSERQLLASLDHPHIAQLFDGGVSADGRPYLVMEYVGGRAIDAFADDGRLTVDQRLDLFLQVCDAVERAHRSLVVHRDLKPANILVSAEGSAKLLDFGVAKLLDTDAGPADAPVTRPGFRMMTPEYSSPEQFLGEPTTTAADVYSLGVVLYELLCGRRPFESAEPSPTALERCVLEAEPEPPSVACRATLRRPSEDVARARGTSIDGLSRRLRGDLDNIVLTALTREPARRYGSVAALKADIRRHLAGLPIAARPATIRYRAAKFVRRHRLAVAAAVLLVVAAGVGATTTWVQAQIAAREGRRAAQIRDFLVGVFEISDPNRSRGESVTARELLDRGSERIGRELSGDPQLQSDMRTVLGRIYHQLGLFDSARSHFEEALAVRRALAAPPAELIDSLSSLSSVLREEGKYDEAEALIREALALARAEEGASGPTLASILTDLAAVHRARGEYEPAQARSREALEIRRAIGNAAGLAETLNGLGVLLGDAGRPGDAVAALEEALILGRQAFGEDHTMVIRAECNLAREQHRAGQLDAAVALYPSCISRGRRLLGDRHPDVAMSLNNLALVHSDRNEYDAAERLYNEALSIQRTAFGDRHREVAGTLNNLAVLAFMRQRYDEAADRFRELVEVWRELLGAEHPDTLTTTSNLGMTLRSAGRLTDAEQVLSDVLAGRRRALGPDHPQVAESLLNLASVVHRQSQFGRARALILEALPMLERAHPDGHPLVAIGLVALGRAQLGEGGNDQALASFDRALALRTGMFGAEHLQTAEARVGRGRALAALGRTAEARTAIETARAHLSAANHSDSVTARDAAEALASLDRSGRAR